MLPSIGPSRREDRQVAVRLIEEADEPGVPEHPPVSLPPAMKLASHTGHVHVDVAHRSTSPIKPLRISRRAAAIPQLGTEGPSVLRSSSLKGIRNSFESNVETLNRILAARGLSEKKNLSFLGIILRFVKSLVEFLDLSDGFCQLATIEDFRVAMNLLKHRPTPIKAIDVSGYCSLQQAEMLLDLLHSNHSIVSFRCAECPDIPKSLLWSLAEACTENEEYTSRLHRIVERKIDKLEEQEAREALAVATDALQKTERKIRDAIFEERRRALVKLSAVEHIHLVSSHRAMKRREQEIEFEGMRDCFRQSETFARLDLLRSEHSAHVQNYTLSFEQLMRRQCWWVERSERSLLYEMAAASWKDIKTRENAKLQKHREAIAAVSMQEFCGRRDLAVNEAQFRSYLTSNHKEMKAEVDKFVASRGVLEDADNRKRRVEIDRLERERHAHKEHCRHEDARIQLERIRERERFFAKLSQDAQVVEREESMEFRIIREIRHALLQSVKVITTASNAEVNMANYCRDLAPACSVNGEDHIYVYAMEPSSLNPQLHPVPWYPMSALGLTFNASQNPDASSTLRRMEDEVRALRKKAIQSMEETEMKLLMEGTERALFCLRNDVGVQAALDPDNCPHVSSFISQRKIVRSASVEFKLLPSHERHEHHGSKSGKSMHSGQLRPQREYPATFVDEIACFGFDEGVGKEQTIFGLQWRCTHAPVTRESITLECQCVVPDDVTVFQESIHRSFCSSVSNLLNRICFRRTLTLTDTSGEKQLHIGAGHPSYSAIDITVTATVDGIPPSSIDPITRKLTSPTPLRVSCAHSVAEKVVTVEVRPPLLIVPPTAPLVEVHSAHGVSDVLRFLQCQTNSNDSTSPVRGAKSTSQGQNSSFHSTPPPMLRLPEVHNDSSVTVHLIVEQPQHSDALLTLMLRVEPGMLILDEYRGAGGARLNGKQITMSSLPTYFPVEPLGENADTFRFPTKDDCVAEFEVDLGGDDVSSSDLQQFLQRCVVVAPVAAVPIPVSLQAVLRVELHDARDIVAITECRFSPPSSTYHTIPDEDVCHEVGMIVSPHFIRPFSIHPGEDPVLVGVPQTVDAHRGVALFPKFFIAPRVQAHREPDALIPPSLSDCLVSGTISVDQINADPDERVVIFAPSLRPVDAAAQRRASMARLKLNQTQPIDVVTMGSSLKLVVQECPLLTLIKEMRQVFFSTTHFFLRPKVIPLRFSAELELFEGTTTTSPRLHAAAEEEDCTATPADKADILHSSGGGDVDSMRGSDDRGSVATKDEAALRSAETEGHPPHVEMTEENPLTIDDSQPLPNRPLIPRVRWPVVAAFPVQVHEAVLPITAKKKRVMVIENSARAPLGPYEHVRPSRTIFSDCYNSGVMEVVLSNGQGPEDLFAFREAKDSSLLFVLRDVKRAGAPPAAIVSQSSKKSAGPQSPTTADLLSPGTLMSPSVGLTALAAANSGEDAAKLASTPQLSGIAGKTAMITTPRKKGPPKPTKLEDTVLEASQQRGSTELMSALSHRRGAVMEPQDVDLGCEGVLFFSSNPEEHSDKQLQLSESALIEATECVPMVPCPFSQPLARAAWYVREHIRRLLFANGEKSTLRRCYLLPHMIRTYDVYRRGQSTSAVTPDHKGHLTMNKLSLPISLHQLPTDLSSDGTSSEDHSAGHRHLGTLTMRRSKVMLEFLPPKVSEPPVGSDDVLAILDNLTYVCDPGTALSNTTKLVDYSISAVDGPENRFSQIIALTRSETYSTVSLLRSKVVYEQNTYEMMCLNTFPIAPYAQCMIVAQHGSPYFDGGKLIVEIVNGGQDGDNLYFMNRDEQLKSKNMYEIWRQEQMFLRSRFMAVDAMTEEFLTKFVPFEGIGEVGATGRMMRTFTSNKMKGDEGVIGMTESYNPLRVVVEFGTFAPEHVNASFAMVALNAVGFRTTGPPGDRTVRISIFRGGSNALQTHACMTLAVRSPQLFIPEGASGRVFAARRALKAPLTFTNMFPTVVCNFSKFVQQGQMLHQGYLEIRMVGPETGERIFLRPPNDSGKPPTTTTTTSTTSTTTAQPQLQSAIELFGRRMFIGGSYIGVVTVATPLHIKIDFEWSSQCTADHVALILKYAHIAVGRGVPPGVSPTRKVEVLLCSGVKGEGTTSVLSCSVALDAPVVEGEDAA